MIQIRDTPGDQILKFNVVQIKEMPPPCNSAPPQSSVTDAMGGQMPILGQLLHQSNYHILHPGFRFFFFKIKDI